jgi:hypothetical protein
MPLPRNDEYDAAVQNPRIAFTDADLLSSKVETTPLGLPLPYSGGFTVTYKLLNQPKSWAVRCFHRDIHDLQVRYETIGNFLLKNTSHYLVEAKYLAQGIRVNGNAHPIIKMQWLEGEPLNIYLSKNYQQKARIEKVIADFLNLINELERYGIAHGDLQHGNIIVKNDKLYLIDYDGMYFPELSNLKTNEIGHVNYQHPKRTSSDYNKNIDRFSEIIIYLGLKALCLKPSLWTKYDNSENILFKSKDFANLQQSELIQDLSIIPEIKPYVERLIGCCYLDFNQIPTLKDFLNGNFKYDKTALGTINISRSQYEIVDATNRGSLLEHFGDKIEVIGRISGKHIGSTFNGAPYMFLNFGLYPHQTFTLVIWQEGISLLNVMGISPSSLVGKWVSVTGVIGSYSNKPQMIIGLPSQIQILSGETEANQRLKKNLEIKKPSNILVTKNVSKSEDDIINEIFGKIPVTNPKKIPQTLKPVTPTKTITSTNNTKVLNPKSENLGCIAKMFIPLIIGLIFAFLGYQINEDDGWIWGIAIGYILGYFITIEK